MQWLDCIKEVLGHFWVAVCSMGSSVFHAALRAKNLYAEKGSFCESKRVGFAVKPVHCWEDVLCEALGGCDSEAVILYNDCRCIFIP